MDLFQDRIRGFGPAPVKAPALMPERFEKDTGCPFPVTVMPPLPPESARAHPASCVVLEWMARVLDHPSTHEQAKWWPSITLVVDELEHRPHSPRVVLVGDTAARAFLAKATESQAWFKVPEALRRLLFGFSAAHRYGLRGGGRGWAFQVPGSPPRVRDLERALWWGSGFRIRSPLLLRLDLFLEWALFRIWPAFLRGRRNRRGIPVVHARKMGRTHGLTWRKRWATPSALELRELDKEALALRPSGDSQE